jgi:collagenase-like PrtC family protease
MKPGRKQPMKIVVGSRGNRKSTEAIIRGTKGRISEIYLSVENSKWGSGRNFVHDVDFREMARLSAETKKSGVRFSLAFNTVCFGREKFSKKFQDEFVEILSQAQQSGFSAIILSDPYLMEIAKNKAPDLSVIVSVFAEVDSESRLKFYNALGVDRIIIPHELNRELEKLAHFANISKCELEVIANLGCSHYCARGDSHSIFTGHYTGDIRKEIIGDCHTSFCNFYKLNFPWEILSQDWIRPEDLHRYENIGIKYLKIAGRATSTSWIIKVANAYIAQSYDGNLQDLITSYYPFTDKMQNENPLPPIPNKSLDLIMENLYSCGHKCSGCSFCKAQYESLSRYTEHNKSVML